MIGLLFKKALDNLLSWFQSLDQETKDQIVKNIVDAFVSVLRSYHRHWRQQREDAKAKTEEEAAAQ